MAISSLETLVLQEIGENTSSPDVFVDTTNGMAPIRDSLNSAIEEIAMLTGSYRDKYQFPLIANQTFYRLKFSRGVFGWITDAWLVNNKRRLVQTDLTRLNAEDPRWMIAAGTPREYAQIGLDAVALRPRPSGTTDMIELECVMVPDRYTESGDRIKLRDSFKWAAVHYAAGEYWASRGDANEASRHFGLYLENMGMQSLYPVSLETPRALKTEKI